MDRRTLLKSGLMAPSLFATSPEALAEPPELLRPHRWLFPARQLSGKILLRTDAPDTPRALIRPEILDSLWGAGAYEAIPQPLHWQMIDAGWFSGAELWEPFEGETPEWVTWRSLHHPECEAHDLLANIFGISSHFIFGGGDVPEFGLELREHPSSPRHATATVSDTRFLGKLAGEIARRTDQVSLALNS